MAYDQGHYQPPSRPYNGRAAAPPSQAYQQKPPPQPYAQQPASVPHRHNDGYGYDGYGNGYGQDYGNEFQQPPMNAGGRGGQNGRGPFPQQAQGYPPNPPQEYFQGSSGNRGPDPRSQGRGGQRNGPPGPGPRPPQDMNRDMYDGRGPAPRGLDSRDNRPPQQGRGGRPAPLERAGSSDPGSQRRQPMAPPQRSPQGVAWDNPFPGFPGAKKKTSGGEEKKIQDRMAGLQINEPRDQRPGTSGGRPSQDNRRPPPLNEGYGRPSGELPRPAPLSDGYGRPSGELQRPAPLSDGYGRPSGELQRPAPLSDGYGRSSGELQRPAPLSDGYGRSSGELQRPAPLSDGYGRPSRDMQRPAPLSDPYGRPSGELQQPAPPFDGYGRPSGELQRPAPPSDGYGRPSSDMQRGAPRAYPVQQQPQAAHGGPSHVQGHSTGPGVGSGSGHPPDQSTAFRRSPQQHVNGHTHDQGGHGYAPEKLVSPSHGPFGPLARATTLPDVTNAPINNSASTRFPAGDIGPSAPYNGPVGRIPPRPSTATGSRPAMQNSYNPKQGQNAYWSLTSNTARAPEATAKAELSSVPRESPRQVPNEKLIPTAVDYSRTDSTNNGSNEVPSAIDWHDPRNSRSQDADPPSPGHRQNESISDLYDAYYHDPYHATAQYGRSSTEANGVNNYARHGEIHNGPMPARQQVNGYSRSDPTYPQSDNRVHVQAQSAVYEMVGDVPNLPDAFSIGAPSNNSNYEQYGNRPAPSHQDSGNRSYAAYDRVSPANYDGPRIAPSPSNVPNSASNEHSRMPLPRSDTMPVTGQSQYEGMPSRSPPVRAGLVSGSIAQQANGKPTPVRNYNNITPAAAPAKMPQSMVPSAPAGPPPVTQEELERLKTAMKNNPSDQAAQLTLAKKWMEAADVLAPQLPDQRARIKAREKYIMDAHKLLKKLCSGPTPFPDAQFFLADCHGRGALGLEPDNKEAFTLYQSAAKAGHPAGAYRTAVCCELGNEEGGGTRKDPVKAIQWYTRAATLGDTPAMYKMGMIQLKGLLGQPKNTRDAITWLKRAAERADTENPHALHELGLLHESQQPPDASGAIIPDDAYALSLFKQAADLGYKFSQFRLGAAYEYGLLNLPISPRDSITWYSRAAVQEEHQSELSLSGWYLTGSEGILQQSDTEAYLWARKAAMAGLAKAEYAMGYFTEVGIGAPADLEGAKRWYWRAAAQNFPKARERLEDLKKGGSRPQLKARERISRSKVGKQNEGECGIM